MKRLAVKRVTALLLAIIMTMSLLPVSAFAAGTLSGGTNVSKANHVTREYTVTVGDTDVTQNAKIHPKGDVDGNGSVNVLDVNRLNLHYKNKTLLW